MNPEWFEFRYRHPDNTRKHMDIAYIDMHPDTVVKCFFRFLEDVYGEDLRRVYLKKEYR